MNGIPFAAILLALSLLTLPAPGRLAPGVPRGRRRRVPVLCAAVLAAVVVFARWITGRGPALVPLAAEILKDAGVFNPRRLFGVCTLDAMRATWVSSMGTEEVDLDAPLTARVEY